MKIGILTFHNAINYGAVLQTYATQELLKSMGYEAEVIDYHNRAIDADYERFEFHVSNMPKKRIWQIPGYLYSCLTYSQRKSKFDRFLADYLNLSPKKYIESSIFKLSGFEAILIGSDQVWNKGLTGGHLDEIYWGNIITDSSTKIIAWSISINNYNFTSEELDKIKNYLNNFSKLSLREIKAKEFIESCSDKKAILTLDPTLVCPRKVWLNLISQCQGNYILSFSVLDQDKTYALALVLAKYDNSPVKYLKAYSDRKLKHNVIQNAGPIEFLSYIANSKYVVSGSFHGTVFSIIFHKQFYSVMYRNSPNNRIVSLLTNLGLQDRIRYFDEPIEPAKQEIDYKEIDSKISKLGKTSVEFIRQSLKA